MLHEKVCVPCAVNRNALSIAKITNLGRVTTEDLKQIVYSDGTEVLSNDLFNDSNFVKDININETEKSFEKKIDLIKCNFIKFLVSHAEDYEIKSISVSGYDPINQKGIR